MRNASQPLTIGGRTIDVQAIAQLCHRWNIEELSIFGSALRGDATPTSDVDVLVRFIPGVVPDLDHLEAIEDELSRLFARAADLVTIGSLRNPIIRDDILKHRRVLYAA